MRQTAARITRSLKTYTARQANILLNRQGQRFWREGGLSLPGGGLAVAECQEAVTAVGRNDPEAGWKPTLLISSFSLTLL